MAYLDENGLAYFKGKLDQITDKLNDQITETDTALDNLTSLIERDTVSGSIVEVNAEYAAPVEKLVVNIEPQQDLHGYESPWPAGCGKNLLDYSSSRYDTTRQEFNTGITLTANQAYTFSYFGSDNVTIICYVHGTDTRLFSSGYVKSYTYTPTEDVTVDITFYNTPSITSAENLFQLEKGSASSTFAPYSNICPISGWTVAEVTRTGKNLVLATEHWNVAGDGRIVAEQVYNTAVVPVKKGETYTCSVNGVRTGPQTYSYFDSYPTVGSVSYDGARITTGNGTFTAPITGYLVCRYASDAINIQVERGSEATTYEEPKGSQISVTFPSSAGTVYGGTLTINPDRTGTLKVDKAIYSYNFPLPTNTDSKNRWEFGSSLPNVYSELIGKQWLIPIDASITNNLQNKIEANAHEGEATYSLYGHNSSVEWRIRIPNTYTANEAQAIANASVICYPINPITYTLTASEISGILSTIRGTNYIWANTGDIAELKYQSGGFATTEVAAQMIEKSAGTKADVITETASGSIVSFSDGADNLPVKSLTVNLEPQQDLHGYDHPWPGGGGVNLNPGAKYNATIFTANSDGTVLVNGEATATRNYYFFDSAVSKNVALHLPAGTYTASFTVISGTFSTLGGGFGFFYWEGESETRQAAQASLNNSQVSHTFSEDAYIVPVIYINQGVTANNAVIGFQIESGSTKTAYSPYSNICPISGWTGAEVKRTGKNLYNPDESVNNTFLDTTTTSSSYGQAVAAAGYWTSGFIPVKAGATYYRTPVQTGSTRACFYNSAKTCIGNQAGSITIPNGASFIRFCGQTTTVAYNGEIQFELGFSASNYQPYQTNREVSISFPSSAGTVYGGTLTINPDRTGTLVVERAMADLGTLNWTKAASSNYKTFVGDLYTMRYVYNETTVMSSAYVGTSGRDATASADNYVWVDSIRTIAIKDTSKADMSASEFKTAMSGVQLVYELANPITYSLTSTEISAILTTLYGTNNIWADTGDITVEYPVDTKLYIQQLTKPTEDDMTADNAIAAGTFFMIGNTLYLATSQIAAGATITPGTNATKLSLADALNQLNS